MTEAQAQWTNNFRRIMCEHIVNVDDELATHLWLMQQWILVYGAPPADLEVQGRMFKALEFYASHVAPVIGAFPLKAPE